MKIFSLMKRFLLIVAVSAGIGVNAQDGPDGVERVAQGIQALYLFDESSGPVVNDHSGVGSPIPLHISDPTRIARNEGSLIFRAAARLESDASVGRLIQSIRRTESLTIEAWVRPNSPDQTGPARLVTLSQNGSNRNFTLGQDGSRFDVRLRTTETSDNGIPSLASSEGAARAEWTHLIYTRSRSGRARIYINGELDQEKQVDGRFTNWDADYQLGLGDEFSGDRPWLGAMSLVALYDRALTREEVSRNFEAGPHATGGGAEVAQADPNERLFEETVASILSQHCLECHDSATAKGDLDLSRREGALKGSESGLVLVPGDVEESYLIESVMTDEMPDDRAPLSDDEKAALREWVAGGAKYTVDVIDPAVYDHSSAPSQRWARRLTVDEYISTIQATFGVDVSVVARKFLPAEIRADGFSNTAYNLTVDLKHVEAYGQLAQRVVENLDVAAFAGRFSKSQKFTDNDNRELIEKMGKWILRGPLSDNELVIYRGISTTAASAGETFETATGLVIEAMLQSPRFLYRVENQQGDGSLWPVGAYELASRMSYLIWGSSPDETLMKLADSGELIDQETQIEQVQRMLKDPRAKQRSLQFVSQWLNLNGLANLRPNEDHFPDWRSEFSADMRAETLAYFEDLIWKQNRPVADALNAQFTYVTPRLAEHYGLPDVEGAMDDETLQRVDLKEVPHRGGILTQGSVLTVGGDEASMVSRGLFVLQEILRGSVKDPPPCVDTTPVPTEEGLTQRGVALERIANSSCGGCHSKFEPLAFGLEKFDGLGTFHEKDEHGNQLREDGEVLFPGEAEPVAYDTSKELMELLRQSDRVNETFAWKLAQFATGRPMGPKDAKVITSIHESAVESGGTYPAMIEALVLSDLVQYTRTEPQED